MRKNLEIVLYYFLIVLAGAIIGDFLYIQYAGCVNLVAGKPFLFSRELVVYGFFESFPVVLILITLWMLLYKIRHTGNPVAGSIIFSVLCLVTWLGIFPLELMSRHVVMESENSQYKNLQIENQNLSKGYFRKSNGKTYYFLEDSQLASAKVLLINDDETPERFGDEMILLTNEKSNFAKQAKPFRDPLVKETMYDMPFGLMTCFAVLRDACNNAWQNGFIAWLCFASIGFALAASYSYIKVSNWRMISVLFIITTFILIIAFNTIYYSGIFTEMRKFLNELFFGTDYSRLKWIYSKGIDFPLTVINLFAGVIILSIGIVLTILKNKREEKDED